MKKVIVLICLVGLIFTMGCSKEWLAHDTVFKNWEHWKFSWGGYEDCTEDTAAICQEDGGWWGDEHQCPPEGK
jgi:hypothetical protein